MSDDPQLTEIGDQVIERLGDLIAGLGIQNGSERALYAIEGCISAGVQKGPDIIKTMVRIGFNRKHAGTMFAFGKGLPPGPYFWLRDSDDMYRLRGDQ